MGGASPLIAGVLLKRGHVDRQTHGERADRCVGRARSGEAEVRDPSPAENRRGLLPSFQGEAGLPTPDPRATASRTGERCWVAPGATQEPGLRSGHPGRLAAAPCPGVRHHLPVTRAPHLPGSLLMTPPRLTDRHSQQQPLGTHRQGSPSDPHRGHDTCGGSNTGAQEADSEPISSGHRLGLGTSCFSS